MATIVKYVQRPSLKQSEIVDDIRRKIAAGILKPGARMPSLTTLSLEYGACRQTTVRAIQHLAKSGHIVTKPRSGTFVAEYPPTLSNLALVFTQKPERGVWSQMLTAWKLEAERLVGIHAKLNRDIRFSFFYIDQGFSTKEDYSKLLDGINNHDFAGLIFPWEPKEEYLARLYAPDLHRVVMQVSDQPPPAHKPKRASENINYMTSDTTIIARGLDFLASAGCRRIAFINISKLQDAEKFYERLSTETKWRGMTTDFHLVQGIDDRQANWAVNCAALMAKNFRSEKVDALFITDDNLLSHATLGLKRAGVRVPEDLLVLSHANFPHVPPASVPVRLIGHDVRGLLSTGIDIIFRKQSKEEVPVQTPVRIYVDDDLPYKFRQTGPRNIQS